MKPPAKRIMAAHARLGRAILAAKTATTRIDVNHAEDEIIRATDQIEDAVRDLRNRIDDAHGACDDASSRIDRATEERLLAAFESEIES